MNRDARRQVPARHRSHLELLKMVSGLVAIAALLAVVAGLALFEGSDSGPAQTASTNTNAVTPGETNLTSSVQTPPATWTRSQDVLQDTPRIVFYLVTNEEQESLARWIEGTGELEAASSNYDLPPRTHQILQVETPEKEQTAVQTVYDTMTANRGLSLVEVVDLRGK